MTHTKPIRVEFKNLNGTYVYSLIPMVDNAKQYHKGKPFYRFLPRHKKGFYLIETANFVALVELDDHMNMTTHKASALREDVSIEHIYDVLEDIEDKLQGKVPQNLNWG